MNARPLPLAACAALALAALPAPAESPDKASPSTTATTSPRDPLGGDTLLETVRILAGTDFGGRLAGSAGYDAAASWAADRFRALGLEPFGGDAYFQQFPIELNEIDTCELALVPAGGLAPEFHLGPDYVCRGFTGSGTFTAPLTFVGWGLSLPGKYDDYRDVDVHGRVVVAFKDAPSWTVDKDGWGDAGKPRPKSIAAAAHGALGLILVTPPSEKQRNPIGSVLHGPGAQPVSFPQFHVAPRVAEELLRGSALKLEDVQKAIEEKKAPQSFELPGLVKMNVHARYRPDAPGRNVVGVLRGSHAKRGDEYLVIGAHLDHVGTQGRSDGAHVMFPGANDNASGSATLLGLAEAFAALPERPRRSVIFVLFAGEEQGIDGSRWFADHPPVPLDKVVAMLNVDCVGHGAGQVELGGGKSAPKLYKLALAFDKKNGAHLTGDSWHGGGADAEPFFLKGLPTLYAHAKDSYEFLHLPGDTAETINPALLENAARLVFGVAREVADGGYKREKLAPKPKS